MNDSVPEEHKAGIDMRRDMLRRSHTLIVCGSAVDEDVKSKSSPNPSAPSPGKGNGSGEFISPSLDREKA